MKLAQQYGRERLEAAATRVVESGASTVNYTLLANILRHGLDQTSPPPPERTTPPAHENVRGATVYQ